MASGMYVLAMTSVCDTGEAFNRLEKALFGIDKMLDSRKTEKKSRVKLEKLYNIRNKKVCEIYQVDDYFDSNEIAKTYTYLYPPGIPIIVPGEVVDNRVIKLINEYKKSGYEVIEV